MYIYIWDTIRLAQVRRIYRLVRRRPMVEEINVTIRMKVVR